MTARDEIIAIMGIGNFSEKTEMFYRFFQSLFNSVHESVEAMIKKEKRRKSSITYCELAAMWRQYLGDGESRNRKAIFKECSGLHNKVECHVRLLRL